MILDISLEVVVNNNRPQFLSEHQKRVVLLSYLGWKPGMALTEYAKAATIFWFGTNNGIMNPERAPMQVPSRKLAEFVAFYAPSNLVDARIKDHIVREYNLRRI